MQLHEPYELGGHWFGGQVSSPWEAGLGYQGFGTDCSGLVSCGTKWAGYNWHHGCLGGWRVNCEALLGGTGGITTATFPPEAPFGPGDILVTGNHVVTVYYKNGDTIDIIEGVGGSPFDDPPGSVVRTVRDKDINRDYLNKGYVMRRLVYTP